MDGAGRHAGERVGHPQAGVVVCVNADGALQPGAGGGGNPGDLLRQRTSVGVAEHDHVGAGLAGGEPGGHGVTGIILVTVEGVLGIVNDKAAMIFETADSVGDHGEVDLGRGA